MPWLALAPLSRHMAETEHLGSRGAKPGGAAVRVSWQEGARPATPAPDAAWPRQEALARPKTAPAHTRSAGHAGPSKLVLQERQYGRPSLFDKEVKGTAHAYLGPKVMRDVAPLEHGFALRGPEDFLKKGDGYDLRTRIRLKELLKRRPVNRDPPFHKSTGGVHLSWESVPTAQSIFRLLYDNSTIDFVTLRWGTMVNEVAWGLKGKKPGRVSWQESPKGLNLDLARWIPIFLEGIREYQEPYRFLAIVGAQDLIVEAGTKLHDFAADMVPPFKKALDTREPTCVTIALELMQSILRTDPEVGKVWIYYLRDFAQTFNLFLSRNFLINMGYNQHRLNSTQRAVNEVLLLMQQFGGEHAKVFMRKWVRQDPMVTDESFQVQQAKAESKVGHQPWKPYLLI